MIVGWLVLNNSFWLTMDRIESWRFWVQDGTIVQTGCINIWIRVSPVDGRVTGITWCFHCWSGTVSDTVRWRCSCWGSHLVWLVTACHDTKDRRRSEFSEDATGHARGCDCLTRSPSLLGPSQLSWLQIVSLFPSLVSFFRLFFYSTLCPSLFRSVSSTVPRELRSTRMKHERAAGCRPQVEPDFRTVRCQLGNWALYGNA